MTVADIAKELSQLEKKISQGEGLLRGLQAAKKSGNTLLVLGIIALILAFIFPAWYFFLMILLFGVGGAIRLRKASKAIAEVSDGLGELRARKAELNALLLAKK